MEKALKMCYQHFYPRTAPGNFAAHRESKSTKVQKGLQTSSRSEKKGFSQLEVPKDFLLVCLDLTSQ